MTPLSKEEIIADALMRIKITDGTNEIGDYMSDAMDQYARQQAISFAIHYNKGLDDRMDVRYDHFVKDQPAIQ